MCIIIGHNERFRVIKRKFQHSTETVHRCFHEVLTTMMTFAREIIVPTYSNVTINFSQRHSRLKEIFPGAIGALDGTLVHAVVPADQQTRYIGRGKAVKFEELVKPAPDTDQKLKLLYQISDKERACFSGVAPSELSCSAENTPSMSSAPKSSTKFSLSDLKPKMIKKEKSEGSPVVKSVHTPTTRAAKRKKSADSIINLESFNDLSAEETKDRLLLGVNHLVQLLKKREDELLEAREECLGLKKVAVEKEGWYKQQEVTLKKEIMEMTGKVEEERKLMAEEAQSSAAASVIEAMYEMAKEASAAGFSLPSWDIRGWAEMLGKTEDEGLAAKEAEEKPGAGGSGAGDGASMGDEGVMTA